MVGMAEPANHNKKESAPRSFAAYLLLVLILFVVPAMAVFVVPLVLRWAGILPAPAR
jgi:hypothetical protein